MTYGRFLCVIHTILFEPVFKPKLFPYYFFIENGSQCIYICVAASHIQHFVCLAKIFVWQSTEVYLNCVTKWMYCYFVNVILHMFILMLIVICFTTFLV